MNLPWRRPGPTAAPSGPQAAVLLASPGRPFSHQAVDTAIAMAGGQPIRVLTLAKIYGTSLGLQNPGLFPSKRELQEQRDIVADAIARIKRRGGKAQGEVVATRNNAKTFLRAARRYSVRHVVLEPTAGGRLRKFVEGDPAATLRHRLGRDVEVHVIDQPAAP
jgi:flagellar basal body rod protein FlgF